MPGKYKASFARYGLGLYIVHTVTPTTAVGRLLTDRTEDWDFLELFTTVPSIILHEEGGVDSQSIMSQYPTQLTPTREIIPCSSRSEYRDISGSAFPLGGWCPPQMTSQPTTFVWFQLALIAFVCYGLGLVQPPFVILVGTSAFLPTSSCCIKKHWLNRYIIM